MDPATIKKHKWRILVVMQTYTGVPLIKRRHSKQECCYIGVPLCKTPHMGVPLYGDTPYRNALYKGAPIHRSVRSTRSTRQAPVT